MRPIDIKPGTALLPLPMNRVREIEEYYRFQFPVDHLAFLMYANLGVPVQRVFSVGRREPLIERFLGVHPDHRNGGPLGWYDIGVSWSQASDRLVDDPDTLDMQLLPVAALFAGDFVCLDFRKDPSHPAVVLWEHEESRECTPFVVPVALSFSAFLEQLREA